MPDQTTTVIVTWDDILHYGVEVKVTFEYERFTDLLRDRISEKAHLDQEEGELFVHDYGFLSVVDPGAVEVEVTFEYDSFEEDDVLYQITPKGKLILALMKHVNVDIDTAQAMANEVYPDDGEVVAS